MFYDRFIQLTKEIEGPCIMVMDNGKIGIEIQGLQEIFICQVEFPKVLQVYFGKGCIYLSHG